MSKINKQKLLTDVVIIRPLIIILVVLTHSLAIYSGAWEPVGNSQNIEVYRWLSKLLQSFRMPTIIFIAGYVYGYQIITLNKKYAFKEFLKNKFKRLIVPSIFFSIIYFFLFYYETNYSILGAIVKILSGCGHLWFLPMLFWGFIALNIVSRIKMNVIISTLFFTIISLLPLNFIPFGIGNLFGNFIYVYLGFITYQYKDLIISKLCNIKFIISSVVIFFSLFIIITLFNSNQPTEFDSLFQKGKTLMLFKSGAVFLAVIGILIVYVITNYFTVKKKLIPHDYVYEASNVCYGIYVFHQFLLIYLYYHTQLPYVINGYLLPIISFSIVLIVSILMTKFALMTKIGRLLIG